MRLTYALALAALTVSPALAQSQYADSTGGYVVLNEFTAGRSGSSYFVQRGADATVGYRLGGGLDAGLRVARFSVFNVTTTRVGPTVGLARPVGAGFVARIEGSLLASEASGPSPVILDDGTISGNAYAVRVRTVQGDLTAAVSRPVRLAGSVRLHPTLGLFAAAEARQTRIDGPGQVGRAEPATAGLHVALPLSFRLFGQDVSLAPAVRFPLGDGFRFATTGGAYAGGGLRLNF